MDRGHLFSNAGITCFARVCDPPAGDPHAHSGFSAAVGSTSQDRTLDDADLALRLRNRGVRLSDALPMVPSPRTEPGALRPILASGDDLIFDAETPGCEKLTYGDDRYF